MSALGDLCLQALRGKKPFNIFFRPCVKTLAGKVFRCDLVRPRSPAVADHRDDDDGDDDYAFSSRFPHASPSERKGSAHICFLRASLFYLSKESQKERPATLVQWPPRRPTRRWSWPRCGAMGRCWLRRRLCRCPRAPLGWALANGWLVFFFFLLPLVSLFGSQYTRMVTISVSETTRDWLA